METHRWRHRDFYVQKRAFRKRIAPAVDARTSWTRRLYRPETRSMWSSNHCSAVRRNAIASPCALCRRAVSACCIGFARDFDRLVDLAERVAQSFVTGDRNSPSARTRATPRRRCATVCTTGSRSWGWSSANSLGPSRLHFRLVFWVQHGLYERMFLEPLNRLYGLLRVVLRVLRLVRGSGRVLRGRA